MFWDKNRGKWKDRQSARITFAGIIFPIFLPQNIQSLFNPTLKANVLSIWAKKNKNKNTQNVFSSNGRGYGQLLIIQMAHTELLPRVSLRHFSTTFAVYIEGWWLSSCLSSMAVQGLHNQGILSLIPGNYWPFHFLLFSPHLCLISVHIYDEW